jgi:hypothetical protein
MKKLLYIFFSVLSIQCFGQPNQQSFVQTSVSGNINVPALQSLEVTIVNSKPISFKSDKDLADGKEFKEFYKLTIKSNTAWSVTYNASGSAFTGLTNNAADNLPAEIIFIKNTNDINYTPLTNSPQVLISSKNEKIVNEYYCDVKINPSWKYSGGSYNLGIIFTLANE